MRAKLFQSEKACARSRLDDPYSQIVQSLGKEQRRQRTGRGLLGVSLTQRTEDLKFGSFSERYTGDFRWQAPVYKKTRVPSNWANSRLLSCSAIASCLLASS